MHGKPEKSYEKKTRLYTLNSNIDTADYHHFCVTCAKGFLESNFYLAAILTQYHIFAKLPQVSQNS